MRLKAIAGSTVIDGTGRAPIPDAVVVVEGTRIRAVTARPEAVLPPGTEIVDGSGKYVIPGLMDANVHLLLPTPDTALAYEGRYRDLIEEAAQVTLRSGVTTVFDTWGPLDPLVAARDRVNDGLVAGSRVFMAGHIIGLGGLFTPDFFATGDVFGPETVERINRKWEQGVGADLLWRTPEEIRRRVRDYIARSDIDFVKYAASGHGEYRQFIAFSAPAQKAIVEEAHRAGITAQAHSTTVESLRMEINAGADLLQHPDATGLEPIPRSTLKLIVDRQIPAAVIVNTDRQLDWVRRHGPDWMRTYVINDTRDENHRNMIKAGARMLLTTDGFSCGRAPANHPSRRAYVNCPDPLYTLGESHFLWLEAVSERGMAPMDALLAATRNVADAYGMADELGTLEPGKYADLLILDADPLADPRNYRRIAQVWKDGAAIHRDSLPTAPVLTAGDITT
jgi:imidazolonepropionase-like amidohydrolase